MNKFIIFVSSMLCVAMFGFAAFKFYEAYSEYSKSGAEYAKLNEYVTVDDKDITTDTGQTTAGEVSYPMLSIDHTALKEQNPDYQGWIYIPGLDISYPMVKGSDNEFYLHNTFERKTNSSGCIFIEATNSTTFRDYNTFIYGHNMKNGSMFGNLKKYVREADCFQNNPCIYLYLPDRVLTYNIFSYYITEPVSDTYFIPDSQTEYEDYIQKIIKKSAFDCGISPDLSKKIITLSTCSGTGENKKRLVVHGIQQ